MARSTIPPEVVACIVEDRNPTMQELWRVADHIEQDMRLFRSAFSWGTATDDGSMRLINVRLALAAFGKTGSSREV